MSLEDIERAWRPKAFREVEYAVHVTETTGQQGSSLDDGMLLLPRGNKDEDITKITFPGSARRASQCITDGVLKADNGSGANDHSGIHTTVFLRRKSVSTMPEVEQDVVKQHLKQNQSTTEQPLSQRRLSTSDNHAYNPVINGSMEHQSLATPEKMSVSIRRRRESVCEDICLNNNTLAKIDLVMEEVCGVSDIDAQKSDDGQYKVDDDILKVMDKRQQDVDKLTEYELQSGVSVSFSSHAHAQSVSYKKRTRTTNLKPTIEQRTIEGVLSSPVYIAPSSSTHIQTPRKPASRTQFQRTQFQRTQFHFDPLTSHLMQDSGTVLYSRDSEVVMERKNLEQKRTQKQAGYSGLDETSMPIFVDTSLRSQQKSRNRKRPGYKPHSPEILVRGVSDETVARRIFVNLAETAQTEEEKKLVMTLQHGHVGKFGEAETRRSLRKALKRAEDREHGLLGEGAVHATGLVNYTSDDDDDDDSKNNEKECTTKIVEVPRTLEFPASIQIKGARRFAKQFFLLRNVQEATLRKKPTRPRNNRKLKKRLALSQQHTPTEGPTMRMWENLVKRQQGTGKMNNLVASHALSVAIDRTLESNPIVASTNQNPVMGNHNVDFNVFNFYKSPEEILTLLQRIAGTVPKYTFDRVCEAMVTRLGYKNNMFLRKQLGTRILQSNRRVAMGQDPIAPMSRSQTREIEEAMHFFFGTPLSSLFESADTASVETVCSGALAVGPMMGESEALSELARLLRGQLQETHICAQMSKWTKEQAKDVISTLHALRSKTKSSRIQRQSMPTLSNVSPLQIKVSMESSDSEDSAVDSDVRQSSVRTSGDGSIGEALQEMLHVDTDFGQVNLPDIVELPNADPSDYDLFNKPVLYCTSCLDEMCCGIRDRQSTCLANLLNSSQQYSGKEGVLDVFAALISRVPRLGLGKYWQFAGNEKNPECSCGNQKDSNIHTAFAEIKLLEQRIMSDIQPLSMTQQRVIETPGLYINSDGSVDDTAIAMLRVLTKHSGEGITFNIEDEALMINEAEAQLTERLQAQEEKAPNYALDLLQSYRQYKQLHLQSGAWTWLLNSVVEGLSFVLASYQEHLVRRWSNSKDAGLALQNVFGSLIPELSATPPSTAPPIIRRQASTRQKTRAAALSTNSNNLTTKTMNDHMKTLQSVVHGEVVQRASAATEEGALKSQNLHGLIGSWNQCRQYSRMIIDVTAKHVLPTISPSTADATTITAPAALGAGNMTRISQPCICEHLVHVPMISAVLASVDKATAQLAKQSQLPEALHSSLKEHKENTKLMMTSLHDHKATLQYQSKNRNVEPLLHSNVKCPQYVDWKPPSALRRLLHTHAHIEQNVLSTVNALLEGYRSGSLYNNAIQLRPLISFNNTNQLHPSPNHLGNLGVGAWLAVNLVSVVLRGLQEILATSELVLSSLRVPTAKKKGVYWPHTQTSTTTASTFNDLTHFHIEPYQMSDVQRTCMLCLYQIVPRMKKILTKHSDLLTSNVDTDTVAITQSFALNDYNEITDGALVLKPFDETVESTNLHELVIPQATVEADALAHPLEKEPAYVRLHRPTLLSVLRTMFTNVKTSQLAVLKNHANTVNAARLVVAPTSMLVPYVAGTKISFHRNTSNNQENASNNQDNVPENKIQSFTSTSSVHQYLSSQQGDNVSKAADIVGEVGTFDITVSHNERNRQNHALMAQNVLHGRRMQGELDVFYKYISQTTKLLEGQWLPQTQTTSVDTENVVVDYVDSSSQGSKNWVEPKFTTFHSSELTHVAKPKGTNAHSRTVPLLDLPSPGAMNKSLQTPGSPLNILADGEQSSLMRRISLVLNSSRSNSTSDVSSLSTLNSPENPSHSPRNNHNASISPRVNSNLVNTSVSHKNTRHQAIPGTMTSPRDIPTQESPRTKKQSSQWLVNHQKRLKNETMKRTGFDRMSSDAMQSPASPMSAGGFYTLHETPSSESISLEPEQPTVPARKLTAKKVGNLLHPASIKTHPYAHMFLSDRLTEDTRSIGAHSSQHTSTLQPSVDLANMYVHDMQMKVSLPLRDVEVMRDVGTQIQTDIAVIQASKVAGMSNIHTARLGTHTELDVDSVRIRSTQPVESEQQLIDKTVIADLQQRNSDVETEAFLSNISEQFQRNKLLNSYATQGGIEIPQDLQNHHERSKRTAYSYTGGIQRRGSLVLHGASSTHKNSKSSRRQSIVSSMYDHDSPRKNTQFPSRQGINSPIAGQSSMIQARALQRKYGGEETGVYMRAATQSIRLASVSKHNPSSKMNVKLANK